MLAEQRKLPGERNLLKKVGMRTDRTACAFPALDYEPCPLAGKVCGGDKENC
jgi:hypothetical protein